MPTSTDPALDDRPGRALRMAAAAGGALAAALVTDDVRRHGAVIPEDSRSRDREVAGRHPGSGATSPAEIPASGWREVLGRIPKEMKRDNVPTLAAGVAFSLLLASVPALIAAFSIFGLVTDPAELAGRLDDLARALPGDAAMLIEAARDAATADGGSLSIALVLSVLASLFTASGGMRGLLLALTDVYDEEETRGFLGLRLRALALTVVAFVFLGAVGLLVGASDAIADAVGSTIVGHAVRWSAMIVGITVLLAVLYRYGPDRDEPRWVWVSVGSLTATLLWIAATAGLSFYAANFGTWDETYGALGGIVVIMLWLQLTAAAILLGAEINAEAERQTLRDSTTGRPDPIGRRGADPADHPVGAG